MALNPFLVRAARSAVKQAMAKAAQGQLYLPLPAGTEPPPPGGPSQAPYPGTKPPPPGGPSQAPPPPKPMVTTSHGANVPAGPNPRTPQAPRK